MEKQALMANIKMMYQEMTRKYVDASHRTQMDQIVENFLQDVVQGYTRDEILDRFVTAQDTMNELLNYLDRIGVESECYHFTDGGVLTPCAA